MTNRNEVPRTVQTRNKWCRVECALFASLSPDDTSYIRYILFSSPLSSFLLFLFLSFSHLTSVTSAADKLDHALTERAHELIFFCFLSIEYWFFFITTCINIIIFYCKKSVLLVVVKHNINFFWRIIFSNLLYFF